MPTEINEDNINDKQEPKDEEEKKIIKIKAEEFFSSFNAAFGKRNYAPIRQVYLDWTYVQDLYLGTLMLLSKEDQYKYIIGNLDKYNDRLLNDHCHYFPELGVTDDQIKQFLSDPVNTGLVLGIAPLTNIFTNLKSLMLEIEKRNVRIGYEHKVILIVNTYPAKLTKEIIPVLKSMINYIDPYVKVLLVSTETYNVDFDLLVNCDLLLVDDLNLFLHPNSKVLEAFYDDKDLKFENSALITPKVIYNKNIINELENKTKEEIDKLFENTVLVCQLSTNFYFVNPFIFVDKE